MSENEIFELAEILADEAYGIKGTIYYSQRQELTVKFDKILKEHLRL